MPALSLYARSVKVPSYYYYKYHSSDTSETSALYYEDIFKLLTEGSSLDFQTVPCLDSQSAQAMLESGDLDLAYDFEYNSDLIEQGYYFSEIPCLTNHVFLIAKNSSNVYNAAFLSTLNASRIGYDEKESYMKDILVKFKEDHNIDFNIVATDYSKGFSSAMLRDSLELCLVSLPVPEISEKVVYSFGIQKFYFVSKSASLIQQIDAFLKERFTEDPLFLSRMVGSGKKNAFLLENINEVQLDYIKKHSPVHVSNDDRFFELTDKIDVKKEFWNMISGFTGFDFIMENRAALTISSSLPCIYEIAEIQKLSPYVNRASYTDAFYSMNVRFICAPGRSVDDFLMHLQYKEKKHRALPRIAITSEMFKVLPYFKEKFIAFDYVIYANIDQCLLSVSKSECDATLVNDIYLQQRYKIDDYRKLRNQNVVLMEVPICVAVNLENPEIMVSILNRAFAQTPYNYYNKLFEAQGIYVQSKPSKEKLWNYFFTAFALSILVLFFYTIVIMIHQTKILQKQINTDSLTGLLSLDGFENEAKKLLHFNRTYKFLLTEINIRDFSFVNRIYGPEKGDKILISLAKLLKQFFSYRSNTLIGHGYADNFYVFQKVESCEGDILEGMSSYLTLIQEMIDKLENLHVVLKSGNVVAFGENDLHVLISRASYARRYNHDSLLENFSIFDDKLKSMRENEEFIESNIERAIKNNEFVVLFQPKVNLESEKICGAEALVRWKTESGLIPPDLFIPVLEKNGLVGKLDQYVYKCVFRYLSQLQEEGLNLVPVSMNISRLNYNTKLFINNLNTLIYSCNIPKKYIELEIEERFAGANDDFIKDFVESLHKEDFKVSMDDFGAGSSSLNMLSEIPVDIVKFDQRFLHYAEISKSSRIILKSTIQMVKDLGMVTVCEGIETKEQADFLRSVGCSIAQGYYYSKPLDEEDFKAFLINHQ